MTSSDYSDDFELINKMRAAKLRAEDFERHQRAEAGLETGDGSNHNSKDKDKSRLATRRGQYSTALSALEQALLDPEYAAAYQGLADAITEAESHTENAIADAKADIADLEAGAAQLADGTLVFKDQNGDVVTAEGKKVDPDLAAGVVFPDGATSYEDYAKRRKDLHELEIYQTDTLGAARDALSDPEAPLSQGEIDEWKKRIEEEAPINVRPQSDASAQDPAPLDGEAVHIEKPQL